MGGGLGERWEEQLEAEEGAHIWWVVLFSVSRHVTARCGRGGSVRGRLLWLLAGQEKTMTRSRRTRSMEQGLSQTSDIKFSAWFLVLRMVKPNRIDRPL